MFIVFIAFRLLESGKPVYDYIYVVYLFLNSMFIVAAYPLVFLLEKIFGLVSVSTLKDLSDTNNTLLQELARKAPGTFQHCLQVANLSERAVNAIHGNARLVKVGAMYHDIGKLVNPQCFIENQAPGIDYHKNLSPQESAQLIIKHVSDGVELAKKQMRSMIPYADLMKISEEEMQLLTGENDYQKAAELSRLQMARPTSTGVW